MRSKTRIERYNEKLKKAKNIPISVGCVNFIHDGNLGFLIRAAVCFGAQDIHVVGSIPPRTELRPLSGSTSDLINIVQHKTPRDFIDWSINNNIKIVAAELCEKSSSLRKYKFNFEQQVCIFTGHETTGVPGEIIHHADCVEIDMPGPGFCLNTSQAANIVLYEATKQYLENE